MTVWAWSTVAADNDDADGSINYRERQLPGTLNDSGRALMARLAAFFAMLGGNSTFGGTANAYTITSPSGHAWTAYAKGQVVMLEPPSGTTNTGAATVNVDGLGAKSILFPDGAAMAAGDLKAGGSYFLRYNGTAFHMVGGQSEVSSFTRGLLDNAGASDWRTDLGLGNLATVTASSFFLTLVDDADAAAFRTTIGALRAASPVSTGVPSLGRPADFWAGEGGPDGFVNLGYGWVGTAGSFATGIYSNGYRNNASGFTSLGVNGETKASAVEVLPTGVVIIRAGTPSGTTIPAAVQIWDGGFTYLSNAVWHAGNDGTGSGLDADTVDGVQASALAKIASDSNFSARQTFAAGAKITHTDGLEINTTIPLVRFIDTSTASQQHRIAAENAGMALHLDENDAVTGEYFRIMIGTSSPFEAFYSSASAFRYNGNAIWHAGNDGAGSGLDADTVDGMQASAFATAAQGTKADSAVQPSTNPLLTTIELGHASDTTLARLAAGVLGIEGKAAARVNSGTAANSGKISWGTAAPGTLAEGEIYLQYDA